MFSILTQGTQFLKRTFSIHGPVIQELNLLLSQGASQHARTSRHYITLQLMADFQKQRRGSVCRRYILCGILRLNDPLLTYFTAPSDQWSKYSTFKWHDWSRIGTFHSENVCLIYTQVPKWVLSAFSSLNNNTLEDNSENHLLHALKA